MSEETRIILVNSVSPSEYITITNDFRKLEKEIENLKKLNNANYQSFIEANNIINELEKWGKENFYINGDEVADKIKELRGNIND